MTIRCSVVVVDRGRARFITAEDPDNRMFEGGPRLIEREDLINPEGTMTGTELFANSRSGRGHASGGRRSHDFDDHRARHLDEIERRFARRVAEATRRFVGRYPARSVVVAADPRMLGVLRGELQGLATTELAEDLSWHVLPRIRQALVRHGVLPGQSAPAAAYRPPGQPTST